MNADQLATFKQKILDAVHAHQQAGGKITSGTFGWYREDKCPIGCLVPKGVAHGLYRHIDQIMGFPVSREEVSSFIIGFDNNPLQTVEAVAPELYQLGQELRAQFIVKE